MTANHLLRAAHYRWRPLTRMTTAPFHTTIEHRGAGLIPEAKSGLDNFVEVIVRLSHCQYFSFDRELE